MRKSLVVVVVFACWTAQVAVAQETQQEIAERIVREQEEIRRRALAKVMTAPDFAARATSNGSGSQLMPELETARTAMPPAPVTAAVKQPAPPDGGLPWPLIACLLPAVPFAVYIWSTLRKRGDVPR